MKQPKQAPKTAELVAVRFVKYDGPYREGEVHRFSRAAAEKLIAQGVAEALEDKP